MQLAEHHKDLVGYFALLTFAGLRPTEGKRVQWQDYSPKVHEVFVRKGKTNARHIILEPVAVAWMKFHRENTPKDAKFVTVTKWQYRLKKIHRVAFNREWIQDGLRHGFGTYFKAVTQDIGKVADLGWYTWLRILWVDGGYTGETFARWVKGLRPKLAVEVVKRSDDTSGFKVLPRRWVVERTFGWLMRQRRLVRDYETTETSAEAWIYIAMIRIQLRRLA